MMADIEKADDGQLNIQLEKQAGKSLVTKHHNRYLQLHAAKNVETQKEIVNYVWDIKEKFTLYVCGVYIV